MKKVIFLAAVVAMVAALAGPASATPVSNDIGAFTGTATVGTAGSPCAPAGTGLRLPTDPTTNGNWRLQTSGVSLLHPVNASLDVCGKLTQFAGLGAACGVSKGYSGNGTITYADGVSTLSNVGWKASAGGTLPVLGDVAGHTSDSLVALVQAQGGQGCITPGGATSFLVAGVYVIASGLPNWNEATAAEPKNDGASSLTNPWGNKK